MQQDPLQVLQKWLPNPAEMQVEQMIVSDGLQRLSRIDALAAWEALHRLYKVFEPESFMKLEQRIALRAAGEHALIATTWLGELPEQMQTEKTRGWQIRLNLLTGNWAAALKSINALPETERQDSRWSYWQARSLEALGRKDEAEPIFHQLAAGRGYYSFLSAERSGLPYRMGASKLDVTSSEIKALQKSAAIKRAYEWRQLGDSERASREWSTAVEGGSRDRWRAAAVLAAKWHWPDRMIQAAYRAGEIDALDKRFPVAFEQEVADASKESGLTPSLIWSIIRQESAFNSDAISRVGAKGLMQLMPATAHEVATAHNVADGSPDLFDPAINIRLGGLYLGKMLERFNANPAVAAAAYNAGPHRVAKWLERNPFEEADIWIETIPYSETRRYVQQVMAFMVVYDWRQAKTPAGIVALVAGSNEEG
jgi:soluble lytic murein transglycosylase